jgi:hypothetical protein
VLARIRAGIAFLEVGGIQVLGQRLPADDACTDQVIEQQAHGGDAAIDVADRRRGFGGWSLVRSKPWPRSARGHIPGPATR